MSQFPSTSSPRRGPSATVIGGLGCLAIVLAALVAGVMWLESFVAEFKKNPGKMAALAVTQANPNVEVVKTNDAAGEITVRNKKTGEEMTIPYSQAKQGK